MKKGRPPARTNLHPWHPQVNPSRTNILLSESIFIRGERISIYDERTFIRHERMLIQDESMFVRHGKMLKPLKNAAFAQK